MVRDLTNGLGFADYCRQHGLTATPQRLAVFEVLSQSYEHPDAAAIYREVRRSMPTISLDTVYRTLRSFEEKGMAVAVATVNDRTRYDADISGHSHFVCSVCGSVHDISDVKIDELVALNDVEKFGSVASVRVELRGVCRDCSNKGRET